MAIGTWVTTLDGLDLHDGVNFITESIPEVDDAPPYDPIMVEMAGSWPKHVRDQPASAVYTLNLHIMGGVGVVATEGQWASRLAALRAVLGPGKHTLTVRRRGMASTKSVQVIFRGMATNYRLRSVSVDLIAPKPLHT